MFSNPSTRALLLCRLTPMRWVRYDIARDFKVLLPGVHQRFSKIPFSPGVRKNPNLTWLLYSYALQTSYKMAIHGWSQHNPTITQRWPSLFLPATPRATSSYLHMRLGVSTSKSILDLGLHSWSLIRSHPPSLQPLCEDCEVQEVAHYLHYPSKFLRPRAERDRKKLWTRWRRLEEPHKVRFAILCLFMWAAFMSSCDLFLIM